MPPGETDAIDSSQFGLGYGMPVRHVCGGHGESFSRPLVQPVDLLLPCHRCGKPVRFTGSVVKVRDGELRLIYDQAAFDRMYLEHSFEVCRAAGAISS